MNVRFAVVKHVVWFYVLNHSKYRFLFHAIYIGIMNGIRKPAFHAARYNRLKYLGSDVRSSPHRGLVLAPTRFNIAPGTALFSAVAARHPENFGQRFSGADFCYRQITASCVFVGQTMVCPTKVLALRGRGRSQVAPLF